MRFITSGSVTITPVTTHINQSIIIQLATPSANTQSRFNYILQPQQNDSPMASWVKVIILIIKLLRIIFPNTKIMLLVKSFSFTPDEANVDDLMKACA